MVFPKSMPYIIEGNELHEKQWLIGSSTKNEVLDRSIPSLIWEDGNAFMYFWRESDSAAEIVVVMAGSTGPIRNWDNHLGVIRFDEMDVMKSIWVGERSSYNNSVYALVYGPSVAEKLDYKEKKLPKTFLLMRVEISLDGQQLEKPLDYFRYKSAGFTTMGQFKKVKQKYIKPKFKDAGWIIFEGEPGDLLYLSFSKSLKKSHDIGETNISGRPVDSYLTSIKIPLYSPPWKVNVPDASHVYVGTFQFRNREKGSLNVSCDEVLDESDLARQVIAKKFPEAKNLVVSLAEKHEKPVVLKTPFAYK